MGLRTQLLIAFFSAVLLTTVYQIDKQVYGLLPDQSYEWVIDNALFILSFLAGISIFLKSIQKTKGHRLIGDVRKSNSLDGLSWRDFEIMSAAYFEKKGYKAEVKGDSGGDGGIDVIIRKKGKRWVVQCKHWNSKVGVAITREMFGVMVHEKADGVKILSTKGFTKQAYEFVKGKPIQLINGSQIIKELT